MIIVMHSMQCVLHNCRRTQWSTQ